MRIESLESTPFKAIHGCFMSAFEDYAVGMAAVTEPVLRRRAVKNNWVPGLSCGVWDSSNLVAITLIGVDEIDGERTAYDICTGVVSGCRGRGLAGAMMDEISPKLVKADISALQLEVLEENVSAIKAYKRGGFRQVRRLVSYSGSADCISGRSNPFRIVEISCKDLLELAAEQDFRPSFEQRDEAIRHLEKELIMLGAFLDDQLVAAIAHDPCTDWLMRLVTHREHRRLGAASALLSRLADELQKDKPVRAINIDSHDRASRAFMQSMGLKKLLGQLEMRLELG